MVNLARSARIVFGILAVVVGLLAAWVIIVRYAPPQLLYRSEIQRTEEAIEEIERYKIRHGVYPTESQYRPAKDNMFYSLKGDGYVIGFNVDFDEWFSYDSHTKKWSFDKR